MAEPITIRPVEAPALPHRRTISIPDGESPVPLGSGEVSRVISTGGGMAVIYEIWNHDLEVKRAVKLLRPDHSQESEERFHTEMKICAKLHHPNIVEIYAVGKWNELPFIEMEEIEGVTVERLIDECGRLPMEVCTSIGIMVGRALNYAHNQQYMLYGKEYHGVIHRDLKPSNIMVCNTGLVKLMDFGIATPTSASMHTMAGTVVGTLQYLAPEQLEGVRDIDVRVDIYSLGLTLYEMLTGIKAFPETNLAHLIPDKTDNRKSPLEHFHLRIPGGLRELVRSCIRKERDRRMPSALMYLRALGKIHKKLTPLSPEQVMFRFMKEPRHRVLTVKPRNRRSKLPALLWASTVMTFAGVIVLIAWMLVSNKDNNLRKASPDSAATISLKTLPEKPDSLAVQSTPLKTVDSAMAQESTLHRPTSGISQQSNMAHRRVAETSRNTAERTPAPMRGTGVTALPASAITSAPSEPVAAAADDFDRLAARYGTRHAGTLFANEVEAGRYQSALTIVNRLSAAEEQSKKGVLYRMRALMATGKITDARRVIMAADINDGEFFLEKAATHAAAGQHAIAMDLLRTAATTPVEFLDPDLFRTRLVWLRARCASALFDQKPDGAMKKTAMEAWFDVKSHLRTRTNHEFFIKADEELRRISKIAIP